MLRGLSQIHVVARGLAGHGDALMRLVDVGVAAARAALAALYLASDESRMVTSTTFSIDGGLNG